jgi:hypothetical protein
LGQLSSLVGGTSLPFLLSVCQSPTRYFDALLKDNLFKTKQATVT